MKESDEIVINFAKHNPKDGLLIEDNSFVVKNYQYDMIKEMLRKFEYLRANHLD